jgi:type IV pilus assembly protein PilX
VIPDPLMTRTSRSELVTTMTFSPRARQQGAVLIVGLTLLVVLIMLGIVASQSAVMQQRLAGNFRDTSLAFESAEAGTRWASAWLQSLGRTALSRPFPCGADCDETSQVWEQGVYPAEPGPGDELWDTSRTYGIDPGDDTDTSESVPLVHSQPAYIMEQQQFLRDDLAGEPQKGVAFYRVTSRGIGARENSTAIVRAVMAKRFE